jgi:hypothetical protein
VYESLVCFVRLLAIFKSFASGEGEVANHLLLTWGELCNTIDSQLVVVLV